MTNVFLYTLIRGVGWPSLWGRVARLEKIPYYFCIDAVNYYLCAMNSEEVRTILRAFVDVYRRNYVTVGELFDIMINSGYKHEDARELIRCAIDTKTVGRLVFRQTKKRLPNKNTVLVIRENDVLER